MVFLFDSIDHISSSMSNAISDIVNPRPSNQGDRKRKRTQASSSDEALEKAKDKLLEGFKKSKRAPRGVVSAAVALAEETLNQNNYQDQFRKSLGRDPADVWQDVVDEDFESTWNQVMTSVRCGQGVQNDNNPGSTTSTNKNIVYRSCTVTLQSVLRPELHAHVGTIERLLSHSQEAISNTVAEVQAVIHKALFAVSRMLSHFHASSHALGAKN
jgi:hypothetical protein